MRVLVISAHPDDETLGCGGTLLKHRAGGDTLHWILVTEAHEPAWGRDVISAKAAEVGQVAAAYGMESCVKLGFPTTRLDVIPQADLMAPMREAIAKARPDVVYTVHGGDVHSDHQVVFAATMAILKPFHMATLGVRRILSYESLSSTDAGPAKIERAFVPNVFFDITSHLERKVEIMGLYETERQPDPLPRGPSALRALARLRGASIGVEYAEAFVLMRERL